jgi:integrase
MEKRTEPITKQVDVEKMLTGILDPRDRLFFNLYIRTAYRFAELQYIKWSDLIVDGHPVVKLTRIMVKSKKGKGKGKKRSVKVGQELRHEIVKAYESIQPYNLDSYIFIPKRGGTKFEPITNTGANKMISKYFKILNIKTTGAKSCHALRKTGAYWFYKRALEVNSKEALKMTCNWLCHSSPAITMIYLGLDREQVELIEDSMNINAARTPLQKIMSGEFEWKGYWTFLQTNSDSPETNMYEYIDFHTGGDATDLEITAALDYAKAVGV